MRFISGLICGLLVSASFLVLAQEDDMPLPENWNRDFEHPWSSAHGNPKFQKETTGPLVGPDIDDNYPLLDLVESQPLLTLNRNDIKSVCISGYSGENTPIFATEIYLTPEARRRVADTLASRDGKQVAFRWFGTNITTIMVDADKVASFKESAEIYPGTAEWNERMEIAKKAETDDEAMMLLNADMSFSSGPSNLYAGYTMTKYLSGTNELQACEGSKDPHDIPGYTEHLEYWTLTKEMYASGKMKQYGYDN